MVGLMTQGAGQEAGPFDLADRSRGIAGPHPDARRAGHLLGQVGDRKAALLLLLLAVALDDDRVDEDDHGPRIRPDGEVDDRDPLVQADLRSRQPDSGRGMAGLDHVGDQA